MVIPLSSTPLPSVPVDNSVPRHPDYITEYTSSRSDTFHPNSGQIRELHYTLFELARLASGGTPFSRTFLITGTITFTGVRNILDRDPILRRLHLERGRGGNTDVNVPNGNLNGIQGVGSTITNNVNVTFTDLIGPGVWNLEINGEYGGEVTIAHRLNVEVRM